MVETAKGRFGETAVRCRIGRGRIVIEIAGIPASSFFLGVLFGTGLLFLGLLLGVRLGRSARSQADRMAADNLNRLAESLSRWTTDVASDVSQYKTTVDGIQKRVTGPHGPPDSQDGVMSVLSEIVTANKKMQERLDAAESALHKQAVDLASYVFEARTDALTGLANRRAFDEEIAKRFAHWQRHEILFGLVMVDVDRFKQINDQHGHPAGDTVLRGVAAQLKETLRDGDFVARYGGEEFGIILPNQDIDELKRATERIRKSIERERFYHEGSELPITVSCGLAATRNGERLSELVKRADSALYRSKSTGRNRSHWHDGSSCQNLTAAPLDCATSVARAAAGERASESALTPSVPSHSPSEGFDQICHDLRTRLLEVTRTSLPSDSPN